MSGNVAQLGNMVFKDTNIAGKSGKSDQGQSTLNFEDVMTYADQFSKKTEAEPQLTQTEELKSTGKSDIDSYGAEYGEYKDIFKKEYSFSPSKDLTDLNQEESCELIAEVVGENFTEIAPEKLMEAVMHLEPEQRDLILKNLSQPVKNLEEFKEICIEQFQMTGKDAENIINNVEKLNQIGVSANVAGEVNRELKLTGFQAIKPDNMQINQKTDEVITLASQSDKSLLQSETGQADTGPTKNEINQIDKGLTQDEIDKAVEVELKNVENLTQKGKDEVAADAGRMSVEDKTFEKVRPQEMQSESENAHKANNNSIFANTEVSPRIESHVLNIARTLEKNNKLNERLASPTADASLGNPMVSSKPYGIERSAQARTQQPIETQLTNAIKLNFIGTERNMTVNLSPPELGKILITFKEVDQEISGNLRVESESVKADIEKALPEIIRTMHSVGVNIKKIEITVSGKNDASSQDGHLNDQWQMGERGGSKQQGGRYFSDEENEITPELEQAKLFEQEISKDSLNLYI